MLFLLFPWAPPWFAPVIIVSKVDFKRNVNPIAALVKEATQREFKLFGARTCGPRGILQAWKEAATNSTSDSVHLMLRVAM